MADAPKPATADMQPDRLQSLDAYRGLIMISLAFAGFGLAATSDLQLKADPDSQFWQKVGHQFRHVEWVGCVYWDMIQPSFMFMVGVSMAYSYAKRQQSGDSYSRMLCHAVTRSLMLIALSIFLMSKSKSQTDWSFMNVLAQIGLGYPFLFLLWGRSALVQLVAAAVVLGGTSAAYELYPLDDISLEVTASVDGEADRTTFRGEAVGVTQDWANNNLDGVRAPWHKNGNIGHAADVWVLNELPRAEPFVFNRGGYQTINFIPSLATMIFGLMCGELLRSKRSSMSMLMYLLMGGTIGIAAGYGLDQAGLCPMVKRIWTPSWVLFSTGICCWILASLFLVIDVIRFRFWVFPLTVVGMNSIAIYCMSMSLKSWTARQLQIHFGEDVFTLFGHVDAAMSPTVQAVLVGMMFWLACFYMYRNRLFVRL